MRLHRCSFAMHIPYHQLTGSYGALPAHGGLWEDARRTAHSLEARLVLEHCTHEAKGLDVTHLVTIPKVPVETACHTCARLF